MSFDIATKRAALTPERYAVYFEGRWYTYAELNQRSTKLAGQLHAAGVQKGDRISILAHNHLAHLDLILATAKLGFSYAPFNTRLSVEEQREVAAYLRPKLLLFDRAHEEKARVTGLAGVSLETYTAWLSADPLPYPYANLVAEDTQMILLTSGSAGRPRGVMQPYRQGFYNAVNTVFSWGLREDDCAVQATPCFHAGVNALTVPLLHLGSRVVLQSSFDAEEYLNLLKDTQATLMFMVPTMYRMLSEHPHFERTDFSGVRWAISGGAPCPAPVRQAFMERGVPFKQGYGLTEAGVNCFSIQTDEAAARPDSVGKPVFYSDAVIRNGAGEKVNTNEVGELTLSGPHLFSGYFERPEDTADALREGWLWTGDLATQDEHGFTIVGRRKEMFISGGENVFPVEVENALYTHPAVTECAVLGVPDAQWGEVGLAAVVLKESQAEHQVQEEVTEDTLRTYLREKLAAYKVPKHLHIVGALPKSGAGKILKTELTSLALESAESSR